MYVGLPILPIARPVVDILFGFMIGGIGHNYPQVKVRLLSPRRSLAIISAY